MFDIRRDVNFQIEIDITRHWYNAATVAAAATSQQLAFIAIHESHGAKGENNFNFKNIL